MQYKVYNRFGSGRRFFAGEVTASNKAEAMSKAKKDVSSWKGRLTKRGASSAYAKTLRVSKVVPVRKGVAVKSKSKGLSSPFLRY